MNKSLGNKYTSHDIQNELLEIIVNTVLREKTEEVGENVLFSIMGDDYTNISNKGQLSLSSCSVKENLEIQEAILGFYQLTNIKSVTFNFPLDNCRGRTYDGASNMVGKQYSIVTRITAEQPKTPAVYCYGHSLSLPGKQLNSSCEVLGDMMGTVAELYAYVKFGML